MKPPPNLPPLPSVPDGYDRWEYLGTELEPASHGPYAALMCPRGCDEDDRPLSEGNWEISNSIPLTSGTHTFRAVRDSPKPEDDNAYDNLLGYLHYQFPATVGHIPLTEKIAALKWSAGTDQETFKFLKERADKAEADLKMAREALERIEKNDFRADSPESNINKMQICAREAFNRLKS